MRLYDFSAGSTADHIQTEDLSLICHQCIAEQQFLSPIETDTGNGIGKSLTGDSFGAEQQNRSFYHIENFFSVHKDLVKHLTVSNFFTPAAAQYIFQP